MSGEQAHTARHEFARRLRELRVPRGFRTARSLAHALGIDENRYTRYERAEVEPSLDLIRRICEALRLTPNDLLGAGSGRPSDLIGATGFGERQQPWLGGATPMQPERSAERPGQTRDALCWLIARELSALEAELTGAPAGTGELQRAGALFRRISDAPFDATAEILQHRAVSSLPGERTTRIRGLIDQLAELMSRSAAAQ
jgi:transcriptional regulator with XRE-family HTH domain